MKVDHKVKPHAPYRAGEVDDLYRRRELVTFEQPDAINRDNLVKQVDHSYYLGSSCTHNGSPLRIGKALSDGLHRRQSEDYVAELAKMDNEKILRLEVHYQDWGAAQN